MLHRTETREIAERHGVPSYPVWDLACQLEDARERCRLRRELIRVYGLERGLWELEALGVESDTSALRTALAQFRAHGCDPRPVLADLAFLLGQEVSR